MDLNEATIAGTAVVTIVRSSDESKVDRQRDVIVRATVVAENSFAAPESSTVGDSVTVGLSLGTSAVDMTLWSEDIIPPSCPDSFLSTTFSIMVDVDVDCILNPRSDPSLQCISIRYALE